eukprot:TRINITY_DN30041_c0_g1_i1.p1 TRINITY_DN30041_c0_g1~~TRINITY_DN30041_c0_g1_i1.p1  ORF type:complete len:1195 (+),score=283.33 TRINITY_DN30041_c0_g1_i1:66-3650(+)
MYECQHTFAPRITAAGRATHHMPLQERSQKVIEERARRLERSRDQVEQGMKKDMTFAPRINTAGSGVAGHGYSAYTEKENLPPAHERLYNRAKQREVELNALREHAANAPVHTPTKPPLPVRPAAPPAAASSGGDEARLRQFFHKHSNAEGVMTYCDLHLCLCAMGLFRSLAASGKVREEVEQDKKRLTDKIWGTMRAGEREVAQGVTIAMFLKVTSALLAHKRQQAGAQARDLGEPAPASASPLREEPQTSRVGSQSTDSAPRNERERQPLREEPPPVPVASTPVARPTSGSMAAAATPTTERTPRPQAQATGSPLQRRGSTGSPRPPARAASRSSSVTQRPPQAQRTASPHSQQVRTASPQRGGLMTAAQASVNLAAAAARKQSWKAFEKRKQEEQQRSLQKRAVLESQARTASSTECTFRPNINNYTPPVNAPRPSLERKDPPPREEKDMEECTFHPQVHDVPHGIYEQPVPQAPGFSRAVQRMARGRETVVKKFEDGLRSATPPHKSVVRTSTPSKTQPKPFRFQTEKRERSKPLLYVDVNLGAGRVGRIGIHTGDSVEVLANNFSQTYGLDKKMEGRLAKILEEQLARSGQQTRSQGTPRQPQPQPRQSAPSREPPQAARQRGSSAGPGPATPRGGRASTASGYTRTPHAETRPPQPAAKPVPNPNTPRGRAQAGPGRTPRGASRNKRAPEEHPLTPLSRAFKQQHPEKAANARPQAAATLPSPTRQGPPAWHVSTTPPKAPTQRAIPDVPSYGRAEAADVLEGFDPLDSQPAPEPEPCPAPQPQPQARYTDAEEGGIDLYTGDGYQKMPVHELPPRPSPMQMQTQDDDVCDEHLEDDWVLQPGFQPNEHIMPPAQRTEYTVPSPATHEMETQQPQSRYDHDSAEYGAENDVDVRPEDGIELTAVDAPPPRVPDRRPPAPHRQPPPPPTTTDTPLSRGTATPMDTAASAALFDGDGWDLPERPDAKVHPAAHHTPLVLPSVPHDGYGTPGMQGTPLQRPQRGAPSAPLSSQYNTPMTRQPTPHRYEAAYEGGAAEDELHGPGELTAEDLEVGAPPRPAAHPGYPPPAPGRGLSASVDHAGDAPTPMHHDPETHRATHYSPEGNSPAPREWAGFGLDDSVDLCPDASALGKLFTHYEQAEPAQPRATSTASSLAFPASREPSRMRGVPSPLVHQRAPPSPAVEYDPVHEF